MYSRLMNRKNRLQRPLAVALALALGTSEALALGLGQVQVKSSLYEPLEAEIPVLSSTPGEAEGLTVRLASPEAFARVGLDRPPSLAANLQFSVVENERGQPVIRITTPTRVNDPFLSFLVEADWGKGRLLREFTVLLDPPTTAPARAAASAPVRESAPAPAQRPRPAAPAPTPAPAAETAPATEAPAARTEPVAPAPTPGPAAAPAPSGDYTVAAGDTLWSVAQRLRPDQSVSVNQMMVALLNSNPDAFINGNINLIKRGAILRMPDGDALAAQSAAEAAAVVREQMDAWRGRQAPQPQPAEPEPSATAATPPRQRQADSRLELVPPRGDQPAEGARSGVEAQSGGGTELRAELARAREDIGTRDQEIRELRSRVEELESIRDDSQRLLQMKDSELAALQRRLAELEAQRQAEAAAAGTQPSAAEPTSTQPPADSAAADPETPAGTETADAAQPEAAADQPAGTPPAEGAAPADDATTVAADASTAPADAEPPVTAPLPESERSTAEPLPAREGLPWYRNPWLLGGLGVIVLGLLVWLLRGRGNRRDAADPASNGRGYDSGALAAAVPGTAAAAVAADQADTHDRESALLDALSEQPEDLDRHLDLVRYYYDLGDADAFEGAAEAMYAQVYDPDDLRWKQVVAMGRELLPDHPLFIAPLPTGEPDDTGAMDAMDAGEPAGDRDWETGNWSQDELQSADTAPEPALDEPAPSWAATDEETPADSASTQQFRFDDLDQAAAGDTPPPPPAEPEPAAFEEPEPAAFDESEPEPVAFEYGGDDASSTKLELARAYLDMGDVEGARGMLEEVMGEGNAGQRAEARRLLDEIR